MPREDADMDAARSLLNAYLDGEVDADERAVVDASLAIDADLRAELAGLAATRDHVRGLPLLEMPAELSERMSRRSPFGPQARPRRRHRTRAAALSALASVAFWGVLAGSATPQSAVPDLSTSIVAAQAGTFVDLPAAEAGNLPGDVDGMTLSDVVEIDGRRHGVYSDGTTEISVVVLRRPVDWSSMPDGERVTVDGRRGWQAWVDGKSVLVLDRNETGYAVIGLDERRVRDVAAELPEPTRTLWERIIGASSSTIEFVGIIP